jgi:tetratricopeptide (TPR) repeat protein
MGLGGMGACAAVAIAQPSLPASCGSLETHFGPFDYRVAKDKLPIVERYHFPPELERLSATAANPGGNLAYTLRAFPNHHRALLTTVNYGQQNRSERPQNLPFTVECFMLRAEAFAPDDAMVKLIAGIYYLKRDRAKEAIERLEAADQLGGANPNLFYNLGLAYLEVGESEKSLENAHKAYAAGFPLPGLRNRLKRAGVWRDAPPATQGASE